MYLNLTESCATLGMNANTEAERAYWQSRENAAVKKPVEIDVHRFPSQPPDAGHHPLDFLQIDDEAQTAAQP